MNPNQAQYQLKEIKEIGHPFTNDGFTCLGNTASRTTSLMLLASLAWNLLGEAKNAWPFSDRDIDTPWEIPKKILFVHNLFVKKGGMKALQFL